MKNERISFVLAATWCAVLGIADFQFIWVYQISKWLLCGVAAFAAWKRFKSENKLQALAFSVLAILFNPISPISFSESEWKIIDFVAVIVFLLHANLVVLIKPSINYIESSLRKPSQNEKCKAEIFLENIFLLAFIIFICCGIYQVAWSFTSEGKKYYKELGDSLKKDREEKERKKYDEIIQSLINSKPSNEFEKYPKALPGGGLDWSRVKGGEVK